MAHFRQAEIMITIVAVIYQIPSREHVWKRLTSSGTGRMEKEGNADILPGWLQIYAYTSGLFSKKCHMPYPDIHEMNKIKYERIPSIK